MSGSERRRLNENGLVILEKYETFLNYIYPIAQGISRKHGCLKSLFLNSLFEPPELFYKALKSGQKSRLYDADACLAKIRFYMRFLASYKSKEISLHQHQTASILIAEVGKMLGAWIQGEARQRRQS